MRRDSKGFSMVELIIVIAIVALLTSILAPMYIKYVNESKVRTDVNNAISIANATSVAILDEKVPLSQAAPGATYEVVAADLPNMSDFPKSKVDASYTWVVTVGEGGLQEITLGGYEIWPNPDDPSDGYRTNNS